MDIQSIPPIDMGPVTQVIERLEDELRHLGPRPHVERTARAAQRHEQALEQAIAFRDRTNYWNAVLATPILALSEEEANGMLPGMFDEVLPPPKFRRTGGRKLSKGADLTRRRKIEIALGGNPATHMPLLRVANPEDRRTCGSCANLWKKETESGQHFYKCKRARQTNNDGPDIVKRWPACSLYLTKAEGQPDVQLVKP